MRYFAHRGFNHLYPENSKEAFEWANNFFKDNNIDGGFEIDIRLTKDNKLIVVHDKSMERVTLNHVSDNIRDLTYNDLKKIKLVNENTKKTGTFMLLSDFLVTFGTIPIICEIKDRGSVGLKAMEIFFQLFVKFGKKCPSFTIASGNIFLNQKILKAITNSQHLPEFKNLHSCCSYWEGGLLFFGIVPKKFKKPKISIYCLPKKFMIFNLLTKRIIKKAKKHQFKISFWTSKSYPLSLADVKFINSFANTSVIVDHPYYFSNKKQVNDPNISKK